MFSYYLLSTGQKDKACKSLRRFAIIYTIIAIAILIPIFEKSMLKNWNYDSDGHKYLTYTAENCEFNDGKFDLPDSPKGLSQEISFELLNFRISEISLVKSDNDSDLLSVPSVTVYSVGDTIVYCSMMSGKTYVILNVCRYMMLLFLAAETITSFFLGFTMLWKTI